jgi:hypothetical protein
MDGRLTSEDTGGTSTIIAQMFYLSSNKNGIVLRAMPADGKVELTFVAVTC